MLAPDGLFVSLTGPFPGIYNDKKKLQATDLLGKLEELEELLGEDYKVLGDAGFDFDPDPKYKLIRNLPGGGSTENQRKYCKSLAKIRIAVEWPFGHTLANFPYLRAKAKMKRRSNCAKFYKVCAFLHNCYLCTGYEHRQVSTFFNCQPPTLEEYLSDYQ